jgi:hypothetical protein
MTGIERYWDEQEREARSLLESRLRALQCEVDAIHRELGHYNVQMGNAFSQQQQSGLEMLGVMGGLAANAWLGASSIPQAVQ